MSEAMISVCFFLFVMATVGAALLLVRWRTEARLQQGGLQPPESLGQKGLAASLQESMFVIGDLAPGQKQPKDPTRNLLVAAGYRSPAAGTIFYGTKVAAALLFGVVLGWIGLLDHDSLTIGFVLFVCGLGFGFLVPDRVLRAKMTRRCVELERALPNSLDLMVLSIEAGQSLDSALIETSRELRGLYPELASEFAQVQMELRAGRSRSEVLYSLGQRTNSMELRKLSTVLIDSDRFGTSLGPALRNHARYLRTRRRQKAQETARKLGVKLVFPVFFLIMPSVFVITLGPAVLTFYEAIGPTLGM
ncbi:type II secretion system F family protein [uncultured Paludibaculum sp.]|uniref:type II secretion system F family protein n=1 Tax=uncultured Paludibaculum sp. TaxID=1765020 RepID=UPI002AAB69A8|nr:type II secretion system F family protein [uncultured Paludibaculum sp.]